MARPQAPRIPISRWRGRAWEHLDDAVAAEEPLQLLLNGEPLSIVMRTPGHDIELALGLLSAERVIGSLVEVTGIRISAESGEREDRVPVADDLIESNQVDIHVREGTGRRPERSFLASSACGVCGKTSIENVIPADRPALSSRLQVSAELLYSLPGRLREQQSLFARTGGLHAAGLFTGEGELLEIREDIGRHNATDKVVGAFLLDDRLPLSDRILMVSGRTGFEIVQKAYAAGIPIVASVSAPSSLAVELAQTAGVTLVGFLRERRFNIYANPDRISRP